MSATAPELRETLRSWAECVDRLMTVAPVEAIMDETGIRRRGHSTPVERKAIRAEARKVVAAWLARDLERYAEPDPEWTTDSAGYVRAPLVNRGTL